MKTFKVTKLVTSKRITLKSQSETCQLTERKHTLASCPWIWCIQNIQRIHIIYINGQQPLQYLFVHILPLRMWSFNLFLSLLILRRISSIFFRHQLCHTLLLFDRLDFSPLFFNFIPIVIPFAVIRLNEFIVFFVRILYVKSYSDLI